MLKNSNRLKQSLNKNSLNKEDDFKPLVINRKDQVTVEFKIISYCLTNLLSVSKVEINDALQSISNLLEDSDSNTDSEIAGILYNLNMIPLIVLNLLSPKLIKSSLDILSVLITINDIKDKVIEVFSEPELFEVFKYACIQHSDDDVITYEI